MRRILYVNNIINLTLHIYSVINLFRLFLRVKCQKSRLLLCWQKKPYSFACYLFKKSFFSVQYLFFTSVTANH